MGRVLTNVLSCVGRSGLHSTQLPTYSYVFKLADAKEKEKKHAIEQARKTQDDIAKFLKKQEKEKQTKQPKPAVPVTISAPTTV